MIDQKVEIDICIDIINWFEDLSISNEEIVKRIENNNYIPKSKILDTQRKEKELTDINLENKITEYVDNLKNVDTSLAIHNQRYKSYGFLRMKDTIFLSCEELKLPINEIIEFLSKSKYDILQSHFTIFTIKKLLKKDDVQTALSLILNISNKDYHYSSYRLIADYYGKKGDKKNFIKWLKKCDARKDIMEIQVIKSNFISKFSAMHTIENTFEIIDSKGFGKMYLIVAVEPITKSKSFNQIKKIISTPRFETEKEYLREIILTNSFINNPKNQTIKNFDELSSLLTEIPARIRSYPSDASLRDNLWSSICESLIENDKEKFKKQIDFSVKKINANWLKKAMKEKIKTYAQQGV